MRSIIDTNILVRLVSGEPADQARRVRTLLSAASPSSLLVTDVHLSELVFVLHSSRYQTPRDDVARVLESVLANAAIDVENKTRLGQALALYRDRGMDWADAYLVAAALASDADTVVSFDRFDAKLTGTGVRRVEPGR